MIPALWLSAVPAFGAPVILEVSTTQDGLIPGTQVPGEPGVYHPVPGSLRWQVRQANQTAPGPEVIIRLQPDTVYPIERPTVWEGINTENDPALDPSHGDMEITRSLTLEGNGAAIDAQSMARVFKITGPIQVTIRDVKLRRGGHAALGGAGVLNGGGTLRITGGAEVDLHDVRFEDSEIGEDPGGHGERRGGAILVTDNAAGRLRVWNGHFEDCRVRSGSFFQTVAGGAIYHDSGSLLLSSNVFLRCWTLQDNTISFATAGAVGGAVCVDGGSVNVLHTRFEENSARAARGADSGGSAALMSDGHPAEGGAVFVRAGTTAFNVFDSVFLRNTAKGNRGGAGTESHPGRAGGSARGGAVAIATGGAAFTALFQRCRFEDNIAFAGPGGNSEVQGGTGGPAEGGAVYTRRGTLDLRDSQFLGNLAVGGNGGRVSADTAPHAKGGGGGLASGGAVHASHEAQAVNVTGVPLQLPASSNEGETLLATALFEGNHAVGGNGQVGYGNGPDDGRGGLGEGGAIAAWAPGVQIASVLGRNNTAQGGHGGDGDGERHGNAYLADADGNLIPDGGGQPIRITDEPQAVPGILVSGRGGGNGNGTGGFLATHSTLATIRDSALVRNQAVGGRLTGRLYHRVAPENGGVWHLQRLDPVPPFVAGVGGFRIDWQGAHGGDGGRGDGGAIHAVGTGRLEILGSGLTFNEARGGNGGPGKALVGSLDSGEQRGGDGGAGGDARGGAVHLSGPMTYRIESSSLFANLAIAGRGGNGGRGRNTTARTGNPMGGLGGAGGPGGDAQGGGLYSDISVADAALNAAVVNTYAAQNKVAGGDGGLGAIGGEGWGDVGGHGGEGGRGGRASGGALDVASLHLEGSTLDRNLVSSGWGGAGGLGNAGNVVGGFGRPGGEGGMAAGGGLAISAGSASGVQMARSTVAYNRAFSGFGGHGGFGGVGGLQGGNGAQGGANGLSRGGGIYNQAGSGKLAVTDSTIAGNRLNAGDGGLRGLRGVHINAFNPAIVPMAYRAGTPPMVVIGHILQPGPPVREGSAAFLQEYQGFQLGTAPSGPDGLPLVAPMDFATPGADPAPFALPRISSATAEISHYAVSAAAVTGIVATTAAGAAVGAIYTGFFTGSVLIGGGAAISTTTVATVAAGGAMAAAGGFAIGTVAVLWVAPVALFTVAMIETGGDFEASAAFVMGAAPERYQGVNPLLLRGTTFSDDDDGGGTGEPQMGQFGLPGLYRAPEGTGIWGGGTLRGTLVANNAAVRRTRPTTEATVEVGDGQGGTIQRRVIEYVEVESGAGWVLDIAGSYASQGANFLGSVNHWPDLGPVFLPQPSDFHGIPGAELDAKIAGAVADHGGGVPTLKLLPGSPARAVAAQDGVEGQSQNGYTWAAGSLRDIGAWGGPPNRAPVAFSRNFRFVQGSGGTVSFNGAAMLQQQADPDGDELAGYSHMERIEGDGSWLVIGFDGQPPGFAQHTFTPDPSFVGYKELYRFRVTDGDLESNLAVVSLQVVPPEDAGRCPASNADRLIVISSEPTTADAATRVELPAEATGDHNFTGPFTIEFWMAMTRPGGWAHEHEALVTKGDSAWRIARGGWTDRLSFDVTGLEPLVLRSERDVNAGWHHVAAVYDGRYKFLYLDGELDAWVEVTGTPTVNDLPVWIGANSERPGRDFRGFVDEVRIWDHARSAGEIRDNLGRTLSGFEPGLVTYYRFDEPAGDVVLNRGMSGTPQPGTAIRLDPANAPGRYSSSISHVAGPVLWEFGTTVVGRHVFYNRSVFDGNNPEANAADDLAIAIDKHALLPGEKATDANRTSYSRGLNGIMIDIARPRNAEALTADDFEFARGNDSTPEHWLPAEPPLSVSVRPGEGVCGSTRVTLIWADHQKGASSPHQAVAQGWLRITVKANSRTGLLRDDTFHFGNAVGESDDSDTLVSAQDALRALNHLTVNAGVGNPLDFNRDGLVSAQDALLVLNHIWTGFRLPDLRHGSWAQPSIAWSGASERVLLAEARRLVLDAIEAIEAGGVEMAGLDTAGPHRLRLAYRLPTGRQGRLLTASAATGPWTEVPGEFLNGQTGAGAVLIDVPPEQPAGFFRIELVPRASLDPFADDAPASGSRGGQ